MKKTLLLSALALLSVNVVTAAEPSPEEAAGMFDPARENRLEQSLCNAGKAILLYIPNRLLDLSNVISLSLGAGPEASLDVAVTQYAQLGGAFGTSYTLQNGFHRQYGVAMIESQRFGAGCWNYDETYVRSVWGPINEYWVNNQEFSLVNRHRDVYRDKDLDFWAISVKAGWLVNAGVAIHPLELGDFFCGLLFIDLDNDDL